MWWSDAALIPGFPKSAFALMGSGSCVKDIALAKALGWSRKPVLRKWCSIWALTVEKVGEEKRETFQV